MKKEPIYVMNSKQNLFNIEEYIQNCIKRQSNRINTLLYVYYRVLNINII